MADLAALPESVESPDVDDAPAPPVAAVPVEGDTVPIGAVAPHPGNPRTHLGDLTELEESIRVQGVLHAPVVLPAPRVAAAWPEHADKLAGVEWVLLIGHRRRQAVLNLHHGDPATELAVLVRTDAIADDRLAQLDAMIAENVAREAMQPIEEARAFAELEAAGLSQRKIAARVGCSQGNVSKRLKLLQLPRQMATDVDEGRLELGDAMAYIDAADGDKFVMLAAYKIRALPPGRFMTVPTAVHQVRREQHRRTQEEALTRKAAEQGLEIVDPARFGRAQWEHRLDGKKAIAAARKAGTLVAAISPGGLVYYSTAKPKKADNRTPQEEQRLVEDRARRHAAQARDAACVRLVAAAPKIPAGDAVALIVRATVDMVGGDAAKLAMRWLREAGVIDGAGLSPYQFGLHLADKPWKIQAPAAYAMALAWQEGRTRGSYRTWDASDAAHLRMLVEQADHSLTDWEQDRLNAIAGADASTGGFSLGYSVVDGWCLYAGSEPAPVDTAGPDIGVNDVDAAQRWAGEIVEGQCHPPVRWQPGPDQHGEDGYVAVAVPPAASGEDEPGQRPDDAAGECRLVFADTHAEWQLYRGEELLADTDALTDQQVDQAQRWATDLLTDEGVTVAGWTSRVAAHAAAESTEYLAELATSAG